MGRYQIVLVLVPPAIIPFDQPPLGGSFLLSILVWEGSKENINETHHFLGSANSTTWRFKRGFGKRGFWKWAAFRFPREAGEVSLFFGKGVFPHSWRAGHPGGCFFCSTDLDLQSCDCVMARKYRDMFVPMKTRVELCFHNMHLNVS